MHIASLAGCWRWVIVTALVMVQINTVQSAESDQTRLETNSEQLSLGFFPIVSTVALFKRFTPLREYLADGLGTPVELKTAKDFPTFVKRTDDRAYDILVTAPHFAVRAADSGKYVIRATLVTDVIQQFVVHKDSKFKSIEDLANKVIATPPDSALMTMMGKRYLKEAGLTGDKAPEYHAFTSHNASNEALIGGEVDAAIASSNIIQKAIKNGDPLRILQDGKHLPNMALLVASDRDKELGDSITRILVGMKSSEKGKEILKQISFPGYRSVTASEYEPARLYMEQAVANMEKAGKL